MAHATKQVPEEHLPLCEGCGYILEGLPAEGRCPECGKPAAESLDPALRVLPEWEVAPGPVSFVRTSLRVLFRPSHFYRHLRTRHVTGWSRVFCVLWLLPAAVLFAGAGLYHAWWFETRGAMPMGLTMLSRPPQWLILGYAGLKVFAIPAILGAMLLLMHLAARLTAWEARYRGLRLPLKVVQRGLDYHAVHVLPVALVAFGAVYGYRALLDARVLGAGSDELYLWGLSGLVIAAAVYLFFTYWAAMRNMLFANR